MLSDNGIDGVYPTTIAKIEAGDRAVRIDELVGIASLFGASTDLLLGRDSAEGGRNDLTWVAAQMQSLARKSANDVNNLRETLADELSDVRYYAELDAPGSGDKLIRVTEMVLSALSEAQRALTELAKVPTPGVKKRSAK
jgi:hypothetical protein